MGNQHSEFKHSRSLPNSPHIKRLGSPYKGHGGGVGGGGSAIPTPALGGRRPTPEHHSRILRSATPVSTSSATTGSQLKSGASASSSRSTSPANGSSSFIPQPRSHGGRASLNEKHSKQRETEL